MTLDEGIKRQEELSEYHEERVKNWQRCTGEVEYISTMMEIDVKKAKEHRQIVEWLKELKELKAPTATLSEQLDTAIKELEMAVFMGEANNALAENLSKEFKINEIVIRKCKKQIEWLKELQAYRKAYPHGVDGCGCKDDSEISPDISNGCGWVD